MNSAFFKNYTRLVEDFFLNWWNKYLICLSCEEGRLGAWETTSHEVWLRIQWHWWWEKHLWGMVACCPLNCGGQWVQVMWLELRSRMVLWHRKLCWCLWRAEDRKTEGHLESPEWRPSHVHILEESLIGECAVYRVVRDCHGRDLVTPLCPTRTPVLELLLRAMGILGEFKQKELLACIFWKWLAAT